MKSGQKDLKLQLELLVDRTTEGLTLSIWQTGSNGNDIYFNNKTDGINADKDVLISDRSSTYNIVYY